MPSVERRKEPDGQRLRSEARRGGSSFLLLSLENIIDSGELLEHLDKNTAHCEAEDERG